MGLLTNNVPASILSIEYQLIMPLLFVITVTLTTSS